jgi:hypothetical protein
LGAEESQVVGCRCAGDFGLCVAAGTVGFEGHTEAAGVVVEAGAVLFGVRLDAGVVRDFAHLGVDQGGFDAGGAGAEFLSWIGAAATAILLTSLIRYLRLHPFWFVLYRMST